MEAKLGQPLTEMAAWQKMKLKTDWSKPQPSLPEYFGTTEEDLDQYCSVFKDIHPETEDPIQEETDETALMIAGHGREHGRNRILGARPPTHRTLTQIKATLTADHPPIARPRHPRRDPALEAAYEAAHADYLEAVREWEVRRAATDTYNGMMSDAMAVFFQTGERVPVMGERPPTPGLLPVFPSKEQFSRAYYSMAPETGCSGNRPFVRASPSSSRETTQMHDGRCDPGASTGTSSGGGSARGSTSPVARRSPFITPGEEDLM